MIQHKMYATVHMVVIFANSISHRSVHFTLNVIIKLIELLSYNNPAFVEKVRKIYQWLVHLDLCILRVKLLQIIASVIAFISVNDIYRYMTLIEWFTAFHNSTIFSLLFCDWLFSKHEQIIVFTLLIRSFRINAVLYVCLTSHKCDGMMTITLAVILVFGKRSNNFARTVMRRAVIVSVNTSSRTHAEHYTIPLCRILQTIGHRNHVPASTDQTMTTFRNIPIEDLLIFYAFIDILCKFLKTKKKVRRSTKSTIKFNNVKKPVHCRRRTATKNHSTCRRPKPLS